ncbi:uncharacterized protein LOC110189529 isoform X2 [Drosophila serrata]|uniref:uncharacterized protein LOC110189529 isoform X2 n=1 Tax=Drosophila serrata TaxID=7274 RepID=UPI000A1D1D23|nr:uncharacterized protein LOC110189529 isoform X2 [Drosophila serrata]
MKLHLVIFLATVLLRRISSQCIEDCPAAFKGNLVCAYINGCYLDMEYCSMLAFNCGRHAQSKHMFLFIASETCGKERLPKCETMDS